MKKISAAGILLIVMVSAHVHAGIAEDVATAQAGVLNDYNLIGKWVNKELTEGFAYNAGSGNLFPADVIEFPGFEAGFMGGGTVWSLDLAGLRALELTSIDTAPSTGDEVDMENSFGMINTVGHVKVGLPFRMDAGIRFGEFAFDDDTGDADVEVENAVWGIEVRKRILGGAWTNIFFPDITVNVSFDSAVGKITRTEAYVEPKTPATYGGVLYQQEITSANTWETRWNVQNVGVKGIISKQLAFFIPFLGIGINKNLGTTKTEIRTEGILSLEASGAAQSISLNLLSKTEEDADDTTASFLMGLELKILALRLGLSAQFAGEFTSYYGGLRFQFR